ncbi:MAG TPA: hypothetical protein VKI99_06195 [Candidatus Dormibacteraeota bacterium]|nr:hypothetical protein [Candidatus Dormibacteraeota bacterium]
MTPSSTPAMNRWDTHSVKQSVTMKWSADSADQTLLMAAGQTLALTNVDQALQPK